MTKATSTRHASIEWRSIGDQLEYLRPGSSRPVVEAAERAGFAPGHLSAIDLSGPEPALIFGGYARGEAFARVTSAGVARQAA
jgi:hypothetical protein